MNRCPKTTPRLVWLALGLLMALPILACGRTAELPPPTAVPVQPPPTAVIVEPTAAVTPSSLTEVVITAADSEAGARSIPLEGATIDGLVVDFGQDRMTLRVAQLSYGVLSFNDLLVEGTLSAVDGVPIFDATRIEPANLATGLIPPLINQFLGSLANDWYVEDVRVEPGQLVLLTRPR